jgi:hypothetical protein
MEDDWVLSPYYLLGVFCFNPYATVVCEGRQKGMFFGILYPIIPLKWSAPWRILSILFLLLRRTK